jgi:hypothetical protein
MNMDEMNLDLDYVFNELKKLKLEKDQNIVWKRFPYSENNLDVIKSAINIISYRKNEYRISYDENEIFVEKDIWS